MREAQLPKDDFDIFEVSAWEAGYHEPTGKIVVVFRYSDRESLAFACDPGIAEELGRGLLALATEVRQRKH